MNATTRAALVVAASLALWQAAIPVARAQSSGNVLANGNFDSDTSGWTVPANPGVSFTRSSFDAIDSASSGSGFVSNGNYGSPTVVATSACLSMSSGLDYDVAAHMAVPAGQQPVTGSCGMWVDWFDNDCVGAGSQYLTTTYLPEIQNVTLDPDTIWQLFATRVTPPTAAKLRAQVVLHTNLVNSYPAAPDFLCYFDQLVLSPAGGTPIPLFGNGFESAFGWSATVP